MLVRKKVGPHRQTTFLQIVKVTDRTMNVKKRDTR